MVYASLGDNLTQPRVNGLMTTPSHQITNGNPNAPAFTDTHCAFLWRDGQAELTWNV